MTPTSQTGSPESSVGFVDGKNISQSWSTSSSMEDPSPHIDGGWEGYVEAKLPEKCERKLLRNVRHHILNVYRRLFSVVFFVNLGILIFTVIRGASTEYVGKIVVTNLFVAVIIREEHVSGIIIRIIEKSLTDLRWIACQPVVSDLYIGSEVVAVVHPCLYGKDLQPRRK